MSIQTAQVIEFRCNSCWQTLEAALDQEGQQSNCPHCGVELVVPEATSERVREADSAAAPAANPYSPTTSATDGMSDAELMKLVQQENSRLPNGQMSYGGFPNASLMSRFFANMLDGFYVAAALGLGLVAVFAAAALGLVEKIEEGSQFDPTALIIFSFFPIVATIVQWNLISTRGQSIGKLVLCIRMVTMDGRLPGFVHGIILRNWIRALLGAFIPFFGIIDVLFIFGDSKRCIHDYIAGTRVVQA